MKIYNSQKLTQKKTVPKLLNVLKRYLEIIFELWHQNCEPTSATNICKNQYSFLLRLVCDEENYRLLFARQILYFVLLLLQICCKIHDFIVTEVN